jgi:hypothetical protein
LILVISDLVNEGATELLRMFPMGAALLVTASDFHESFKVSISVSDFPHSEIVVKGTKTTAQEIDGVISTIPYFLPQEFYHVDPADREYVCAEVSAFLIYFLSELSCKKLNPPSTRRLSGLSMNRIEWLKAATRCGVPIWPVRTKNGTPMPMGDTHGLQQLRATIVGDITVGECVPRKVGEYMRTLSQLFGMPYLSGFFVSRDETEYFLADLESLPDVSIVEHREAIAKFMRQPSSL